MRSLHRCSAQRFKAASIAFLLLAGCFSSLGAAGAVSPTQKIETRTLISLLEQAHYNRAHVNVSDFPRVIPMFVAALDEDRMVFLKSDLERFTAEMSRDLYLKLSQEGDVAGAIRIHQDYVTRLNQRVDWVLKRLASDFDLSNDESYAANRTRADYPATKEAADELWRQRLEAELIDEMLHGDSLEAARVKLSQQYTKMRTAANELKADDVSELFLSTVAHLYDAHSTYFSGSGRDQFIPVNDGQAGIGALLAKEGSRCVIREAAPGGAAAEAGLSPHDRVISIAEIGAEPIGTRGLSLRQITRLTAGPINSELTLTFESLANGSWERKTVRLRRHPIDPAKQRARAQIFAPTSSGTKRFGVLTIPALYGMLPNANGKDTGASEDVTSLLQMMKSGPLDGMIVDLRGNGGGYFQQAVELAGLFLPQVPIVQTKNYSGELKVELPTRKEPLFAGPLVVLVDATTASGAEIIAGSLQVYGRAVVVGPSTTYGHGTIQTVLEFRNLVPALARATEPTGLAKFTVQKFYLPNGVSTQALGITPDIVVISDKSTARKHEVDEPYTLPNDRIAPCKGGAEKPISKAVLEPLRAASAQRQANHPDFESARRLAGHNVTDDDLVSLNLADRRRQQELQHATSGAIPDPKLTAADSSYEFTHFQQVTIDPKGAASMSPVSATAQQDFILREALRILEQWSSIAEAK